MYWKTVDHSSADQLKRQKSALSKKLTPLTIDNENNTGSFESSSSRGFYLVTLENCDCMDFTRRKVPCKHMYRLAHELGVYDLSSSGNVKSGRLKSESPFTTEEIIEILPEEEARAIKYWLYFAIRKDGSREFTTTLTENFPALISIGFIKEKNYTAEYVVNWYVVSQLKAMLKENNIPFKSTDNKKALSELAIEHLPDILVNNSNVVQKKRYYFFNPEFEGIWSSLYYQLTQLYPEEEKDYFSFTIGT